MTPDRENVRFNALRNALYHTARRRALERMNRVFNLAVILLGAAAIGDVLARFGIAQSWIGAAVALIGALQLVFDFGRQARDHQTLQRDYYSLLADIEAVPSANDEDCATWQSRLVRIAAEEPPMLRALDAKAYNDAIDALEFGRDQRLHVPLLHRILAAFVSFEGHDYRKLGELGNAHPPAA
ncbi:hypothetical protein [Acidimangrovimonas sediminis]|uniref:hypothetical protein n=1 Tax=Acidimangrovimonas sediminis TaxID=2056283 RepID=UPI0011AF46E5|nr:hypothetical protein [Acidimangrovimonas sediminis]